MMLRILAVFFVMAYGAEYPREVTVLANCSLVVAEKCWCVCLKSWWQDSLASWNHLDIKVENGMCVPYVDCWALQSSFAPTDSTNISPVSADFLCKHCSCCCKARSFCSNFWINQILPLCQQKSVTKSTGERYHVFCSQIHTSNAETRDENLVSMHVMAAEGTEAQVWGQKEFPYHHHQIAKDNCPPV